MNDYEIKPTLQKILNKLSKKDFALYKQVLKKIEEIVNSFNIENYKNLRHNLKDFKRVYIGHFVLVFKFNKIDDKIYFEDFEHHDKIYKR
jgi:YafQ family addiction module toxin component